MCFGKPGSDLNSFSAHYATLSCFLYWLLLLSLLMCPCRREQTSTVSEAKGDLAPLFTSWITMHSSSSPVVSTLSTVLLPLETFSRKNRKKNRTFSFLNFAIMKCQSLLEVRVGAESWVANEATNWAWRLTVVLICPWLGANMAVLNSCISHIFPSVDDCGQSCVCGYRAAVSCRREV